MRNDIGWTTLLATLVLTAAVAAQEQTPVFRSGTELAYLTATVTDRDGRPAAQLRQEDFTLYEDDVRQDIAFFGVDDQTPISVVVVVDASGSMTDKMDDVHDALEHFMTTLRTDDEVSLFRFSDVVDLVAEGVGADRARLRRAVERLTPGGATALHDAIHAGVERAMEGRHRKKVVIVISDGNDTASDRSEDDAAAAVRQSEVLLYALGIGHGARGSYGHGALGRADEVDGRMLRSLAESSGGRAWVLEGAHRGGVDLVDQAITEIGVELRQQYTLGYYPKRSAADRSYLRLRVEVKDGQYRVRTRSGLFARTAGRLPLGSD